MLLRVMLCSQLELCVNDLILKVGNYSAIANLVEAYLARSDTRNDLFFIQEEESFGCFEPRHAYMLLCDDIVEPKRFTFLLYEQVLIELLDELSSLEVTIVCNILKRLASLYV